MKASERGRKVKALIRERELYVVVRPSVCLYVVCNVGALYSDDWNFRQYF